MTLDSFVSQEKGERVDLKTHFMNELYSLLDDDWVMDVGDLDIVPSNSQVLQKREGYRQIFELFLNFEFAFRIEHGRWAEMDDLIHGYQKKLSELYEYWCYVKLLSVLGRLAGQDVVFDDIFERSEGWTIRMKRGQRSLRLFDVEVDGQTLQVGMVYNKLFSQRTKQRSYSLPFRPDYTMMVEVSGKI